MAADIEYIEMKKSSGERYLHYYCESCQVEHTVEVDATSMKLIAKAVKVCDAVLLWCGRGTMPTTEAEFNMVQVITPRRQMSKQKKVELERTLKYLEIDVKAQTEEISKLQQELADRLSALRKVTGTMKEMKQNGI